MFRRRKTAEHAVAQDPPLRHPREGDASSIWYKKPAKHERRNTGEHAVAQDPPLRPSAEGSNAAMWYKNPSQKGNLDEAMQSDSPPSRTYARPPPSPFQDPLTSARVNEPIHRLNPKRESHLYGNPPIRGGMNAEEPPVDRYHAAVTPPFPNKAQGKVASDRSIISLIVRRENWIAVTSKLDEDQTSARQKDTVVLHGQKTSAYPLHVAVCFSPPVSLIESIIVILFFAK